MFNTLLTCVSIHNPCRSTNNCETSDVDAYCIRIYPRPVLSPYIKKLSVTRYGVWDAEIALLMSRVSCQKGPYLPCVSMAGRALFAGYPRCTLFSTSTNEHPSLLITMLDMHTRGDLTPLFRVGFIRSSD